MKEISISSIPGFAIGSAQDTVSATGCTVIIAKEGAAAGCDVRGGGPATRETDLLSPGRMVQRINAVVLSGGSAYGLDCAGGVMKFLEENGMGFDTGVCRVPIVCGASLYDLTVGDHSVRPDAAMGYSACRAAMDGEDLKCGNFGAGTGCSVGKVCGMEAAMKSGLGTYAVREGDLMIGAVIAVNALGDVYGENGRKIAGCLKGESDELIAQLAGWGGSDNTVQNTTIGCIITNAELTKTQCSRLATVAHDGMARAIRPVHTDMDGDALFVMSEGRVHAGFIELSVLASKVVQKAIENAVFSADPAYGLQSAGSI